MTNYNDATRVLVLRHAGKSYISTHYGSAVYQHTGGDGVHGLQINDKPAKSWPPAPGDPSYIVIDGEVTSAHYKATPRRILTGYKLRPDAPAGLKQELSVEEGGDLAEDIRDNLYVRQIKEEPVDPKPWPIEYFDLDVPPRAMPEGVIPTVPDFLGRFPTTWHALPCYYARAKLWPRVRDALRTAAAHKAHFTVNLHESLKSIKITSRLKLMGIDQELHFTVLELSEDGKYGAQLPLLSDASASAVLAKVDAWIAAQVARLDNIVIAKICPCCGQDVPPGSILAMPAPKR